jgi:hypothetical protein
MLRAQSVLVMLFTMAGIVVMLVGISQVHVAGAMALIIAAIGALIATVGLSAFMIVSAIRNPLKEP